MSQILAHLLSILIRHPPERRTANANGNFKCRKGDDHLARTRCAIPPTSISKGVVKVKKDSIQIISEKWSNSNNSFLRTKFSGVRFAESSASSSSSSDNNSSDQSLSQLEDGATGVRVSIGRSSWDQDNNDGGSSSLMCSMVDKATLNKLTKEDLLLLWQAAESEWLAKVRALSKQRDILQLRYQHAKVNSSHHQVAAPVPVPPNPYQPTPTPPPLAPTMMKF
jgi:hypothetical protein